MQLVLEQLARDEARDGSRLSTDGRLGGASTISSSWKGGLAARAV